MRAMYFGYFGIAIVSLAVIIAIIFVSGVDYLAE